MKIKEKSKYIDRCLVPKGYWAYETEYIAENSRKLVFTMAREFKASFMWYKRPSARVYWAKEIKSKNISGLKSMPYKDPGET